MKEKLPVEKRKHLYSRKRLIITAGAIGVISLLVLFVLIFRQRTKPSSVPTPTPTVTVKPPTEVTKTEVNQP